MLDVTRRGFLTQVSVATGVGLAGGAGLHKLLVGDGSAPTPAAAAGPVEPGPAAAASGPSAASGARPASAAAPAQTADGVTLAGPMLIHIRDLATAEIAMMVGTQELVYRDPELVARLLRTAASAGRMEG